MLKRQAFSYHSIAMKKAPNIFTDFLSALHVPHTYDYSVKSFESMPFQSWFGLSKLLAEYKVDSKGYMLQSSEDMLKLPTPYLAKTNAGQIIVTNIDNTNRVASYLSQGKKEKMSTDEFVKIMPGEVLMAFPASDAEEPDYAEHCRDIFFKEGKNYLLIALIAALVFYLWVTNGIYRHVSLYFVALFDCIGLWFSTYLLQKTLKIHNPAADRVCKVIEEGGCDSVLKTSASSFFGIFSWSEVGFSYFFVSLMCLLIFPQFTGYLALINLCCLPFSFWSVWYQKFRAKAWCTLCLGVQATLWILALCYLLGGWWSYIFPLRIEFVVLIATYALTLLVINKISTKYENSEAI